MQSKVCRFGWIGLVGILAWASGCKRGGEEGSINPVFATFQAAESSV